MSLKHFLNYLYLIMGKSFGKMKLVRTRPTGLGENRAIILQLTLAVTQLKDKVSTEMNGRL